MRHIDTTDALKRFYLGIGERRICYGCGAQRLPPDHATSRWNASATLCTKCATEEALGGATDPFQLGLLQGGRLLKVLG